jgi:exodeoxyribonuclease V alpha subunit
MSTAQTTATEAGGTTLATQLDNARRLGALRDFDVLIARELLAHAGEDNDDVRLAIVALSQAQTNGDVCLPLAGNAQLFAEKGYSGIERPALRAWRKALRASRLVSDGSTRRPLVLDGSDRLYFEKYWDFERTVERELSARAEAAASIGNKKLRAALDTWFAGRSNDDLQKIAAAVAVLRRLAVIAGGPGTGKTTTVARVLALLIALHDGDTPPHIRLAAPTGKAAARLTESITGALERLRGEGAPGAVIDTIPRDATTLHRLLGVHPDGSGFRHHAGNRLALDVLVIDEASMVDLPLMARLLAALPENARLILLGDPDQLASVEAGAVLGDICNRSRDTVLSAAMREQLQSVGLQPPLPPAARQPGRIGDSLVVLTRAHRYEAGGAIARLASAVNNGDTDAAHAVLREAGSVRWSQIEDGELILRVQQQAQQYFLPYLGLLDDPRAALRTFDEFRVLCATRVGRFGVQNINRLVERALGLGQSATKAGAADGMPEGHYAGRPILVTRNDYGVGLYNGDIGMVLPDAENGGRLRAFFPLDATRVRRVALNRLPEHETVFAMTIHKSQGSEFPRALVLLPESANEIVTRELLYTGITRAKQEAEIWAPATVLDAAIRHPVERSSGLRDALWPG